MHIVKKLFCSNLSIFKTFFFCRDHSSFRNTDVFVRWGRVIEPARPSTINQSIITITRNPTNQPINLHRLTNTNLPSYQITSCLPSPKYAELLKPSNLPFLASFIHTLYIHICFICKGTCQIILQTLLYLLTSCLLTCQPASPPIPIPPPPFVINSHQSITLYHSDINRPFTNFPLLVFGFVLLSRL